MYILTVTSTDQVSLLISAHKVTNESESFILKLPYGKSLLAEVFGNDIEKMCDCIVIKDGKLRVKVPQGSKVMAKKKSRERSLTTIKKRNLRH